jgi:prophage regulatory protein
MQSVTASQADFAGHSAPAERILPIEEVFNRTGLRRTSIYDLVKRGLFPPPVSLGAVRRVGFVESEVNAWISDRIAASRAKA